MGRLFMICLIILSAVSPCLGNDCRGDFDCNGVVDGNDLLEFALNYGSTDCPDCITAPVPKTGQEVSYDTGDDGDLQMGVPWPAPRFVDNGDGTVTDKLTGLIWLKNANCSNVGKSYSAALSFANSLFDGSTEVGSGGDCGLSDGSSAGDWRLPNVNELISLIDFGRIQPALPVGHPFTSVQLSYYWSSTKWAGTTNQHWAVYIYYGLVIDQPDVNSFFVWPVRTKN